MCCLSRSGGNPARSLTEIARRSRSTQKIKERNFLTLVGAQSRSDMIDLRRGGQSLYQTNTSSIINRNRLREELGSGV